MKSGYLSQCRPCDSARKSVLRAAAAKRPVEPPTSIYRVWIPTARLRPQLLAWCERNTVSSRSQATTRRVFAILNEQDTCRFDTVDRLLIDLDLGHLWHLPEADGGLADIYECGPDGWPGSGGLSADPFAGGTHVGAANLEREAA
jgi:hypothetical protein